MNHRANRREGSKDQHHQARMSKFNTSGLLLRYTGGGKVLRGFYRVFLKYDYRLHHFSKIKLNLVFGVIGTFIVEKERTGRVK